MIEYTQTELRIMAIFSAIGAVLSFLVGGFDVKLKYLLVLTVADYITGMTAAAKAGELSSAKAFDGIMRKVIIIVVVSFANAVDGASGVDHVFRAGVIVCYAIMEAMSITENIDKMGYGHIIPGFIRSKLAQIENERGIKS